MFKNFLFNDYKKNKLISFIILLSFILYYNLSHVSKFYFDAQSYWDLGRAYINNGRFDLLNYNNPLRGYLYPLINYCIQSIAFTLNVKEIYLFSIFSALFFSFFITVLIPNLFEEIFDKQINILQNLLFSFFIVFFWRGYFLYPLTDFISLFLLIASLYLMALKNKNLFIYILCGILLGATTIIRPIYLIAIIPFCIFFILEKFDKKVIKIVALLCGMIMVYIPQSLINYNQFNTISPMVQTNIAYNGSSLYLNQIQWGIYTQKYETNIGENYNSNQVFFYDRHGINLLIDNNLWNLNYKGNLTYFEYIKLFLSNPIDFTCIYFKHFFNGIDLKYHTPYVNNIFNENYIFSILNYTLFFLLFVTIYKNFKKIKLNKLLYILPILLPILFSIPCAVETRFFLSIYLIAYANCCYWLFKDINFKNIKMSIRKYLFLYCIFIIICFTLSSYTYVGLTI